MVARPHGGRLVNRVATTRRRERILAEAPDMPKLEVDREKAIELEDIARGVYSPLEGFMLYEDAASVMAGMRLANDVPWTIPVVLDVREGELTGFSEGDEIVLTLDGRPLALMEVEEIYPLDRREMAEAVFGTDSLDHPGVARTMEMGELALGGRILLLNPPPNPFERYTLWPAETRVLFREKGWKTVVGFQTRNAPHRGHEALQKAALAIVDGVFINPVVGRKKRGDFRDEVIVRAYEALISNYYPRDTAVMSVLRYEMRYAGPREAVHHAIMRKNFGCTHFVVGRDHAGVGNFFGPYDAQEIFKEFPDLGIEPMFFREFFYCRRCGGMANEKTCPHPEEDRVRFSGTRIRELISAGEVPPPEVMRPEVAEALLTFDDPFV